MLKPDRLFLILLLLSIVAAGIFIGSLMLGGDLALGFVDILKALYGNGDSQNVQIVRELRLPRAETAFVCGGLLAVAGALMQVLLRNPLADPYILGISGGASVGALTTILFGGSIVMINISAFSGALAVTLLVFGLAHGGGSWSQIRLLLTGVVVAAGCGAVISLILVLAPHAQVHSMLFWIMGDASGAANPRFAAIVLLLGLVMTLPAARDLNIMAQGELAARALGINVRHLRWGLYFLAALLTASAVTQVGTVGFIGLIVPHLVRLAVGNDQRILLPASALTGGTLLLAADTAARTLAAPIQLPVGVLTALFGVPAFLFLLARQHR